MHRITNLWKRQNWKLQDVCLLTDFLPVSGEVSTKWSPHVNISASFFLFGKTATYELTGHAKGLVNFSSILLFWRNDFGATQRLGEKSWTCFLPSVIYALSFLFYQLSHQFWDIKQKRLSWEGLVQFISVHAKTVQDFVITFILVCFLGLLYLWGLSKGLIWEECSSPNTFATKYSLRLWFHQDYAPNQKKETHF